MKQLFIVLTIVAVSLPLWGRGKSAASSSDTNPQITATVNSWMQAFQKGDVAGLLALGNPSYDEWIISNGSGLRKNMTVEAALHPVTEYRIDRVVTLVPEQQVAVTVQEIVEDEDVREWEATLMLKRVGGSWKVTHVSHVVIEYHMHGYPLGCPDTVFRREEIASLDGNLTGGMDPSFVRVFSVSRDTESWGGRSTDLDTESTKCQMTPGTSVNDLDWLVAAWSGELLLAQRIGRATPDGGGIVLYEGNSNGSVTRGGIRLETVVTGQPAILFLSRKYEADARLSAFMWKGGALKNVWNFDFMRKGASFAVDKKAGPNGLMLEVILQSGGDAIGCPEGTIIPYEWTGSSFKPAAKVRGGCKSSSWPSESSVLNRNGFKVPPAKAVSEDDQQSDE